MGKRKPTQKEQKRVSNKNNKNLPIASLDFQYIDKKVLEYFKSLNLYVVDIVSERILPLNIFFTTHDRWFQMKQPENIEESVLNKNTKTVRLPAMAITRSDIEVDSSRKFGFEYKFDIHRSISSQNNSTSRSIDAFLSKKNNTPKYQFVFKRNPVYVNINYDILIIASKMLHINSILTKLLQLEAFTDIHDEKYRISLIPNEVFPSSEFLAAGDSDKFYQIPWGIKINTFVFPEIDAETAEYFIQRAMKPIKVEISEEVKSLIS